MNIRSEMKRDHRTLSDRDSPNQCSPGRDSSSVQVSVGPLLSISPTVRTGTIWAGTTWLVLLMMTSAYGADETSAAATLETDSSPAELSVAPLDHVEYPADRPKWLERKPIATDHGHSIVVVSEPCESPEDAEEQLRWMQRAAVATYINELVDSHGDFDFYRFDDQEIDDDLIVQRYRGTVNRGDMTEYECATELVFSESKRKAIKLAWKNREVSRRLGAVGGMASVGLVLLMCSSGLLGILARRFG